MKGAYMVFLACAVEAVVFASSASETEAKTGGSALLGVGDWASGGGGVISASTSTQQQQKRQQHRGKASLVSHWLDPSLGPSVSQESFYFDSSSSSSNQHHHDHHKRGNSSSAHSGKGKGKGGRHSAGNDDDKHKPLLPLAARDYLGLVAASLAILLASGSGIGGGGLLVPVFLLVLGFGTRDSVALSNLTILGSSLVSLFFNLPRRHPRHADRPLIDWDIIQVMEPSTICGAVLGGYLNKITPTWLTTTLLAVLLTAMAVKLAKRARAAWELERDERRRARLVAIEGGGRERLLLQEGETDDGEVDEEPLLLPGQTLSSAPSLPSLVSLADEAAAARSPPKPKPKPHSGGRRRAGGGGANGGDGAASPPKPAAADEECPPDGEETVEQPLETSRFSEPRAAPPQKVALIFALTLFVLAADLAKQLVSCGSLLYWLTVASVAPPSLAVALFARRRLVKEHALRERGDSPESWPPLEPGEVSWTQRNSVLFPAVSTLAGVVAGFFGVGGGIVKGPLMLEMGVDPTVAAATSITMILFTSSAASVLYISFGVPVDYAKVVFATGALFTALGQSLVSRLVRKMGPGVVVVMMAAMMGASASVVTFEAVELTRRAVASGNIGGHGHIC